MQPPVKQQHEATYLKIKVTVNLKYVKLSYKQENIRYLPLKSNKQNVFTKITKNEDIFN
jgi:hypothetical protein